MISRVGITSSCLGRDITDNIYQDGHLEGLSRYSTLAYPTAYPKPNKAWHGITCHSANGGSALSSINQLANRPSLGASFTQLWERAAFSRHGKVSIRSFCGYHVSSGSYSKVTSPSLMDTIILALHATTLQLESNRQSPSGAPFSHDRHNGVPLLWLEDQRGRVSNAACKSLPFAEHNDIVAGFPSLK